MGLVATVEFDLLICHLILVRNIYQLFALIKTTSCRLLYIKAQTIVSTVYLGSSLGFVHSWGIFIMSSGCLFLVSARLFLVVTYFYKTIWLLCLRFYRALFQSEVAYLLRFNWLVFEGENLRLFRWSERCLLICSFVLIQLILRGSAVDLIIFS